MRSKKYPVCLQILSFIAAAFGVFAGCEGGEDELAVVSVVNDGIALIEDESLAKVMHLTTKDFLAQPGKLNRKLATTRLYNFFRSNSGISVLHPAPEVEILDGGESALVKMPFVVAKKGVSVRALEDLYDDEAAWTDAAKRLASVGNVQISLVKENDRWLIRTVRF